MTRLLAALALLACAAPRPVQTPAPTPACEVDAQGWVKVGEHGARSYWCKLFLTNSATPHRAEEQEPDLNCHYREPAAP